jgi:hypothetical protein
MLARDEREYINHDVETILGLYKREGGERPEGIPSYMMCVIRSQAFVGVDDDVLTVRGVRQYHEAQAIASESK